MINDDRARTVRNLIMQTEQILQIHREKLTIKDLTQLEVQTITNLIVFFEQQLEDLRTL